MAKTRISLLGTPGSGKGSQAKLLCERYSLEWISTGALFREAISNGTALGRQAAPYLEKGVLVPYSLTMDILRERLSARHDNFLLDGFPRTIEQAKSFADINSFDYVIFLRVPAEVIVSRLSSRYVCSCGIAYNLLTKKPKQDLTCDVCKKPLYRRDDDRPEVIRSRLAIYHQQTEPLIKYYEDEGILLDVDGSLSINKVFSQITSFLDG